MATKKVKIAKKGYSPSALSDKFKKLSRSMKIFVMIAVLLAVGGGYYGFTMWQENQDNAKAAGMTPIPYSSKLTVYACKTTLSKGYKVIKWYIKNNQYNSTDSWINVYSNNTAGSPLYQSKTLKVVSRSTSTLQSTSTLLNANYITFSFTNISPKDSPNQDGKGRFAVSLLQSCI